MQCTNPVRISKNLDVKLYPDGLLVPCGKCLSCRIAKRSEWSMRMLHELESYDCAVFVTLTYDDEHLPEHGSLVVSDLQKFSNVYVRSVKKLEKTFDTLLVVNTVTVTVALIITLLFSDYLNPRLIKLSWIVSGLLVMSSMVVLSLIAFDMSRNM